MFSTLKTFLKTFKEIKVKKEETIAKNESFISHLHSSLYP